jgi:hypothetical protein
MEPTEMVRSIECLLAQQAEFVTDLQRSRELSDQRHGEITRALMGLTAITGIMADSDRKLGGRMDALARKQEAMAEAIRDLAVSHRETDTNLGSFLLVVDKYFRERSFSGPH